MFLFEMPMAFGQGSEQCVAYDDVEELFKCGSKGYPINYGGKYCKKFSENRHRFSDEGKKWLDATLECLVQEIVLIQDSLRSQMNPNNRKTVCKRLKHLAFDSHIPCYLESGYCDLSRKDKRIVTNIVFPSIFRIRVIQAGLKVQAECRRVKREERRREKEQR